MKLGKLLGKAARTVKANPEVALMVAGLIAPKVVAKAAPKIAAAVAVVKAIE